MSITVFVAKVGRGGKDGKTYWQTVGRVLKTEKGYSLKLDCIPVGKDWDGWISLFAPQEKAQQPTQEFNDDVPF